MLKRLWFLLESWWGFLSFDSLLVLALMDGYGIGIWEREHLEFFGFLKRNDFFVLSLSP